MENTVKLLNYIDFKVEEVNDDIHEIILEMKYIEKCMATMTHQQLMNNFTTHRECIEQVNDNLYRILGKLEAHNAIINE